MIFVDTSVMVCIILEEKKAVGCRKLIESKKIFASIFLETEMFSVLGRVKIKFEDVAHLFENLSYTYPIRSLKNELIRIYENSYCRGADAFHIACAMNLDPSRENIRFFTLDEIQKKAAQAVGFKVVTI